MYIYTANAFVYGHFKGDMVKEQVYEPDWRGEERTQYTINVANILADVCPRGRRAVDPELAARLQAAGHRRRRGRELYRSRAARRRASGRARIEDRTHRAACARAGAVLLSRNHRRDRRLFHAIISIPAPRLRSSPSSRSCRSRRRTRLCAGISASSTTSAIRRSNTRTSPSRCRSWSMAACRSSSCRRPPLCMFRK